MRNLLPATILALAVSAAAQTTVYSNAAPRATATVVAGSDVGAPTLRMWGGSATDGVNLYNFGGRMVDTLGNAQSTYFNGLDAYNPATNTWTNLSADGAAGAPSNRFRVAFCYDPLFHRLVSYGGYTAAGGTILSDCWVFDLTTNTWSQIANPTPGTTGPQAVMDAKLCFDATTTGLVLFGGSTTNANSTSIAETWVLYGNTWVQMVGLTPGVDSPEARRMHAMTERPAPYNDVVLASGRSTSNGHFSDLWRWDGAAMQWSQITPNGGTTAVTSAGGNEMVYDTVRDVLTIIGGTGTNVAPSTTTGAGSWNSEYDCVKNEWRAYGPSTISQTADDPVLGRLQRFCCEHINGKTYLWAGQNPGTLGDADLAFVKEYQASPLANATPYGAGCSGPGGMLTLTANNAPWTFRTFSATCSNLGAASFGMPVWGETQGSTPLNLLLPNAGAGCSLLHDAAVLGAPALPAGGSIEVLLQIPINPALAGYVLNLQVAELEFAGADWAGTYTSNGLELTLGAL